MEFYYERQAPWLDPGKPLPTIAEIEGELRSRRYRRDPIAYVSEVLKVDFWQKQIEVCQALLEHKRVFVKASHSVGKSFLAGSLVNWFFDCFRPGICLTTAPNVAQVRDVLWKEVRVQRPAELREALQPRAPRMETGPDHFAVGYTARDDSGFQGRHEEFVFIVFDECVGVQAPFWEAAEGMMTGPNCYWLVICNPTDTSSRAYTECQDTEKWHVIEISALDHPNIASDLANEPARYPKAVRLEWVQGRIREWCTRVSPSEHKAGDFEFPLGSSNWYRPGALFESKVLGVWPTQGSTAVWSESMWKAALVPQSYDPAEPVIIGCDVARFGDDFTSIVVRRGPCVLLHETHNGWSTAQTAGRLKQLAREFGKPEKPESIEIHIDDDGVGGGVTDQAEDFNFQPISGANKAVEAEGYPNRRSEMWFTTAGRAADGCLDLSRLSAEMLKALQKQVMAPTWKLDGAGRRVVEQKSDTKKRIGRSPDDADALNLAFAVANVLRTDQKLHTDFWDKAGRDDDSESVSGWDD